VAAVASSSSSSEGGRPEAAASASRAAVSQASTGRDSLAVTGILLVGGASSRFGSPKALARLGGETLAERAWRALAWCDERLGVGKAADELPLPFPVRDDGTETRAPLAGVVAGLRLAAHDVCVVLPVDCPRVMPALLEQLARACRDAAVPQTGPLPGAYRRTALSVLERRLAAGELSLRGALTELDVETVELDAALLVDVDSPEELRALELTSPARPASG
jgi:molybdopterin-guanine dinucleotide biosynthesis protein A